MAEKQTNKKIKAVRSDNGSEYLSNAFQSFLNGIKRQLTVLHTPQQNGVAERANRTLIDMARSLMLLELELVIFKVWAKKIFC